MGSGAYVPQDLVVENDYFEYDEVLRDINYRDQNDSSRKTAPLAAADDAVLLDTTKLDLAHSFEKLCELIQQRFDPSARMLNGYAVNSI